MTTGLEQFEIGDSVESSFEKLELSILYESVFVHEVARISFMLINYYVLRHPVVPLSPLHLECPGRVPGTQLRNTTNHSYFLTEFCLVVDGEGEGVDAAGLELLLIINYRVFSRIIVGASIPHFLYLDNRDI